jgi:PBSX family phage terminase large subunit
MAFKFTPKQLEAQKFLAGPARHKLIFGGARSGKTFVIVRRIVMRAMIAPRSRHLIARFRQNAVRASIGLDTLPKVMELCFTGRKIEESRQDGYFELTENGSQIWLAGLDEKERIDKILGQEYVTEFFNECSQIPRQSITTARTRLAQVVDIASGPCAGRTLPQVAYYDLNPVGSLHWSNQEFVRKGDPDSKAPLKQPDNFVYMTMNPVDNRDNLSKETIDELEALPERQRKRFYEGVFVNDVEGALWPAEVIEACRLPDGYRLPQIERIVVAVDPSGTRGDVDERSDNVGIIVAGKSSDGKAYVLADRTVNLPPEAWARVAVQAYHEFQADTIVAEINYGGAMVESVIRAADMSVSYKEVTASRGKWVRAEPVSALYAQDKVRHVGRFPDLEDEMENYAAGGYVGPRSPDRADALVWALSELMLGDEFDAETYLKAWD